LPAAPNFSEEAYTDQSNTSKQRSWKWVKITSQNLHRLYKPVVEARESLRPSLIAGELYGDHIELKEEGGLPLNTEGSNNSDDKVLVNRMRCTTST
jgi:hypothetical protein